MGSEVNDVDLKAFFEARWLARTWRWLGAFAWAFAAVGLGLQLAWLGPTSGAGSAAADILLVAGGAGLGTALSMLGTNLLGWSDVYAPPHRLALTGLVAVVPVAGVGLAPLFVDRPALVGLEGAGVVIVVVAALAGGRRLTAWRRTRLERSWQRAALRRAMDGKPSS